MRQFYTTILLALLITFGSSCKKDPDLLQKDCMLQNGELNRPKIIKEEISFKISSNIPNEQYGLYIYNSEDKITEIRYYDKSDSSLYKTTRFVYTDGFISEFSHIYAPDTSSHSSITFNYIDGYFSEAINGSSTYIKNFYRDQCNFTCFTDKPGGNSNPPYTKNKYEIKNGNIVAEQVFVIYPQTGNIDSTSRWYNYSYYNSPNQIIDEVITFPSAILQPFHYNRNLLKSEEMCVRWPDGHTACTGADFEYDFDEQGRITKMTRRERGSIVRERWFYYE